MADNFNPALPAGNISGNETADAQALQAQIQKYVAEALAAGRTPEPARNEGPSFTPVTLNDPITGQELKFNSPEELKIGFAETLARYGASQQQIAQLATQLGRPEPKPAVSAEEFSRERLAELAEKDPLEGIRYVNKFALKDELNQVTALRNELQNLRGEMAAHEFRAGHPQMQPILNDPQGLKQFMTVFQQAGHQTFTRETLESTYAQGVAAGLFPPPASVLDRWRGNQGQSASASPALPPYLGGNSGGGLNSPESEVLRNFDSLSGDQMQAVLSKLGAFGPLQ